MSKFCQHCGSEIEDNSVFCEKCGKDVNGEVSEKRIPLKTEKICKTCGEIHDKKIKFCPNCGVNTRQLLKANLVKCKGCNHSIAANAITCPSCGKKTHYNLKITMLVLGIFLFVIIIMSALLGGDSSAPSSTDTPVTSEKAEQTDKILYSDDFFDIEYMKLYDVDIVNTSYLQLKVTNKSDKKLTLLLDNVYVNDIAIETGTGMPIELEPGKISTTPFVLFTGNTGLSAEDITKIEFKLKGMDDSFNVVHTSEKVIIEKQ